MGVVCTKDLGIGTYNEHAYIRVVRATYQTALQYPLEGDPVEVPEWEIEIHSYLNKDCRDFEICKEEVLRLMALGHYDSLSDEQKLWLNENILARSVRPLQTMTFATIDIEGFPDPEDVSSHIPFFYNYIKNRQVMGLVFNIADDYTSKADVLAKFFSDRSFLKV